MSVAWLIAGADHKFLQTNKSSAIGAHPKIHNRLLVKRRLSGTNLMTTTMSDQMRAEIEPISQMSLGQLMHNHLHMRVVPEMETVNFTLPENFMKKSDEKRNVVTPLASMKRPIGHVFGVKTPVGNAQITMRNIRPQPPKVIQAVYNDEASTLLTIRSMKNTIQDLDTKIDELSDQMKGVISTKKSSPMIRNGLSYTTDSMKQVGISRKRRFEVDPMPPPNMVQCKNCGNHVAQVELVYHKVKCFSRNPRASSLRTCPRCALMFNKESDFFRHVHRCDRGFYKTASGRYIGKAPLNVLTKEANAKKIPNDDSKDLLGKTSVKELISKFREETLAQISQQQDKSLLYPDELPKADEKGEMKCVVTKCTGMLKPRAERNKANQGKRWRCNSCGRFYRYVRAGDERLIMAAEWATRQNNAVAEEAKPFISQITYHKTPPPFVRSKSVKNSVKVEPKEEVDEPAPILLPEKSNDREDRSRGDRNEEGEEEEDEEEEDEEEEIDSEEEELRELQMQLNNMSRQASSIPESAISSSQPSPLPSISPPVISKEDTKSVNQMANRANSSSVDDTVMPRISLEKREGEEERIKEDEEVREGEEAEAEGEGDSGFISVEEIIKRETRE